MGAPEGISEEKERPRILIVDDDPDCRQTLAVRFTEQGYNVSEASDGPQAIESVERQGADVVLLDILMKGMDGFAVMEQLRASDSSPHIILLSAMTGVDYRLRGLHAGASDYITKPFDGGEVVARVANLLRQRFDLRTARAGSAMEHSTGLFTRASFEKLFRQEVAWAKRQRRPLALVLMDADGLSKVNDRYGHMAGNRYIDTVGQALAETCRESDFGGHLGGGEFGVLLPDTDTAGTAHFLVRLWQNLSAARVHLTGETHPLKVSASMGYAVLGTHTEDASTLWNAAVESLAHSKQIPGVSTEQRLSA